MPSPALFESPSRASSAARGLQALGRRAPQPAPHRLRPLRVLARSAAQHGPGLHGTPFVERSFGCEELPRGVDVT